MHSAMQCRVSMQYALPVASSAILLGYRNILLDRFLPLVLVKPGVRYRDLGSFIQKHAQSKGCSVTKTYCGHGIHR